MEATYYLEGKYNRRRIVLWHLRMMIQFIIFIHLVSVEHLNLMTKEDIIYSLDKIYDWIDSFRELNIGAIIGPVLIS